MSVVERDIQCEHDLPPAVRRAWREIDLDAIEGRISEAERDELITALLVLFGIPPVRADD